MILLGIETSCDETAAAVVRNGRKVLSSVVATQFEHHAHYSGVVPELASRAHVVNVNGVVDRALKKAKVTFGSKGRTIDGIAVTIGPGLAGSLLVGRMTAEGLGWVFKKPVIGVNHIEGHLLSPVLSRPSFKPPFLGLVVSGGHTELILARKWGDYRLIGRTRDDAAGEAFDKVAKMMKLGYPGGPVIDKLAKRGRAGRFVFPKPWLPGTWDFSFSGLKTSVLYKLREKKFWSRREKEDLCAGFQDAVVTVLAGKTLAAARAFGVRTVAVGGGVAANSALRDRFLRLARRDNVEVCLVPPHLCTDNAAMVASSAYFLRRFRPGQSIASLRISPSLRIPSLDGKKPSFKL